LGKIISVLLVLFFILNIEIVHASGEKTHNVLIVYTPKEAGDLAEVRILDSLVGHFTERITVVKDTELENVDIRTFTHVLYMGHVEKQLPRKLVKDVTDFKGPVFLIGKNSEQFPQHSNFFKSDGGVLVSSMHLQVNGAEMKFAEERLAERIETEKAAQTLVNGVDASGTEYPLVIKKGKDYYYALESLFNPSGYFLGEILFDFFDTTPSGKHMMYLRLEDVHPKADADELMEIARFLNEKKIPYIIALIPVYVDPDTKKEIHLKDAPKLVRTLKYMQDHGGSVILHGYRHQYRQQETGEGFEFWDVDMDRPILQDNDEKPLSRKDFNSDQAYDTFLSKGTRFEEKYIGNAILNGVQELTAHELYPLAFEAPHYAMSEKGYEILSKHFSTYIGQVQLSNQTWKQEYAPLYTSTPSFLYGMRLFPETVGYVLGNDPQSVSEMKRKAVSLLPFSDAVIAGFYHPYLGIDGLKDLVAAFEKLPNTEWLDLKDLDNQTVADDINIATAKGKVNVEKKSISSEYEQKLAISKTIPWLIAVLSGVSVLIYWLVRRRSSKKT